MHKEITHWYTQRLEQHIQLVRWGHYGTPVLLFPTAGGDAEEVERFHLIHSLAPLIDAGKIKVYSTDSVAGHTWVTGEHSTEYRSRVQNLFDAYIYHEVMPAIRNDCKSGDIEIITAGASIGAFNAVATVCRHPDAFRAAVGMSGTYDLSKLLNHGINQDFYYSSPLHFLSGLEGPLLDQLRTRFILLASGEGDHEDIGESWRMADVLGSKGIPNRVDSWGPEWPHDWETWREMLPQYLAQLA
ncbi:MAG: hypothetical protein HKO55_05940 [Gammaproteobacteria bacterium]|nr:hypothetical protein [Gammaproteobacteria bacterium]